MGESSVKPRRTGALTVGDRLAVPEARSVQSLIDRPGTLASGHRACRGCGEALGARWVLDAAVRATEGRLITVNATGCLEVFSTPYPESAWRTPWLHSLFGNAPSVAAGVAAALRARGDTTTRVIGQGGDGGTVDIGFAALSGMFERDDDVLYVCYDNQAYMNTGVQRSGATPPAARTATTPAAGRHPGSDFGKGKNTPAIAMAHQIPYTATATVADLHDLEDKVTAAMAVRGTRYLHVLVPCPLGWGTPASQTVGLARLAVATGLFPLFEARDGRVTATTRLRRPPLPVDAYLSAQKRFRHLFAPERDDDAVARIQAIADANVDAYGLEPPGEGP